MANEKNNKDNFKKRILILAANPKDMQPLCLDKEVREIEEGLNRSTQRDQFEIIAKLAVRTDDLRRALLDVDPHIVHFSSHGTGESGIALENSLGQTQLVTASALTRLFQLFQKQIECVLLNACYSDIQASAIHSCIDTVIGMNQAIGDQAAIKFSIGFYDALGAGRKYKDAYEFGCSAIDLDGIPESLTPVLYHKANDAMKSIPAFSEVESSLSNITTKNNEGKNATRSNVIKTTDEIDQLQLDRSQEQSRLAFAIAGSVDQVNEEKLKVIVALLRKLSGDTTIEILEVQEGSIRLILHGSPEGLKRLQELFESGELLTIIDKPIEYVNFLEAESDNQNIDNLQTEVIRPRDNQLGVQSLQALPTKSNKLNIGIDHMQGQYALWKFSEGQNPIDLSYQDLRGQNLSGSRYANANLTGTRLSGADLTRADLSGARLSGADLVGVDLSGTSLNGADLVGADLSSARLNGADLTGADLTGAKLNGAKLADANLTGAILVDVSLRGTDMSRAVLCRATLKHAVLRRANLTDADLTEADCESESVTKTPTTFGGAKLERAILVGIKCCGVLMRGTNLSQAQLTNADLRKADLRGAKLEAADFSGADLSGANVARATMTYAILTRNTKLCGTKLNNTVLSFSDLTGADLTGAELEGSELKHAILNDAQLCRANMRGANLRLAQMENANLSEAHLQGVYLTGANLRGSILNKATLLRAQFRAADLSHVSLCGAGLRNALMNRVKLRGANLQDAQLAGAHLVGADLRNTNLYGADLSQANLAFSWMQMAQLQEADLSNANLNGVLLDNANLDSANLNGAKMVVSSLDGAQLRNASMFRVHLRDASLVDADMSHTKLNRAYLAGSQFKGARLAGANLAGTNLMHASLENCNLEKASLIRAYLSHADLAGANLRYADLSGVDFTNVNLDEVSEIEGARYDKNQGLDPSLVARLASRGGLFFPGNQEWDASEQAIAFETARRLDEVRTDLEYRWIDVEESWHTCMAAIDFLKHSVNDAVESEPLGKLQLRYLNELTARLKRDFETFMQDEIIPHKAKLFSFLDNTSNGELRDWLDSGLSDELEAIHNGICNLNKQTQLVMTVWQAMAEESSSVEID